jgi:haloalkane dehalogenase
MRVLRTPDECFARLPGFPFAPHYVEIPSGDGVALRVHYVDEGPRDAAPVLLLHGEPSWSFLYRKMIPGLVAAGHRVVAPDLVGFGRSDKPAERSDYTYQRHVDWLRATIELLDLRRITLFCQDWGGLLGLRLVAEEVERSETGERDGGPRSGPERSETGERDGGPRSGPERSETGERARGPRSGPGRFARVVAANTFLPTGDGTPSDAFLAWRAFSQKVPELPVGRILQGATVTELPPEVVAAYDAPFPDESYKSGARQFPVLVPIAPDDPAAPANRAAWAQLERFAKPFLTAFSDQDPVTRGGDAVLQARIPGARGRKHVTIAGGGHFLQEDCGEELARVVADFIAATRDAA